VLDLESPVLGFGLEAMSFYHAVIFEGIVVGVIIVDA